MDIRKIFGIFRIHTGASVIRINSLRLSIPKRTSINIIDRLLGKV